MATQDIKAIKILSITATVVLEETHHKKAYIKTL